jgi:hypothetical protein
MAPPGSARKQPAKFIRGYGNGAPATVHLQQSSRSVQMSNKLVSDLQVSLDTLGQTRQMEKAELRPKADGFISSVADS